MLAEAIIHTEDVVDDLDRGYGETDDSLREHLLFVVLGKLRRLERLVPCKEDCGDHLHNTKELSVLYHKEDMIANLLSLLIDWPCHSIHRDEICE